MLAVGRGLTQHSSWAAAPQGKHDLLITGQMSHMAHRKAADWDNICAQCQYVTANLLMGAWLSDWMQLQQKYFLILCCTKRLPAAVADTQSLLSAFNRPQSCQDATSLLLCRGRLLRSTSSPQPILQQQHSLEQTTLNIEALEQTQSSLAASAGAPAAPSLLPKHRRHTSNPNTLMRASSLASGIRHSTAAAQATGPAAEVMAHAAVDGPLPGSASGAGGAQDSATASASSAGTSWSSLRQLFGSSRAPRGSAASAGSSTTLGRSGSMQAAASSAGASNASTAAQQLEHIQVMLHSRQQLQLIQEAAPLAPSQPPMSTAANPPSHLRRHASEPAASFLVGGAAASRAQSAGPSVLHGGPPAQLQAGTAGGGTADGAVISRRISPIVSVFEDTSSATSGDSFTPAAWHHADRQLLEEQPVSMIYSRSIDCQELHHDLPGIQLTLIPQQHRSRSGLTHSC